MGGERFHRWEKVTIEELQAYMGFMILMGICHLPSIYHYWKTDEFFYYSPVAKRISRDRFFELHRYLHFVENSTLSPPGNPEYDKLGKIRPIIARLLTTFQSVYCPHMTMSVDEAMIRFKGRSSLKQYMPKKPIKRGIKVWAISDSLNGYLSEFEVYTGKKSNTTQKNLGATVVKTLTRAYTNTYRHIYFDNYFTSIGLLLDLLKFGLYACGTMRADRRGFPEKLKSVAKKGFKERGESQTYQRKNLTLTVWQDNRTVCAAATNADPTSTCYVLRKNKDGTRSKVKCPKSIALYNQHMGGVDRNDQLRGYYHVRLKCRKYYKYIFWFLFDVAVTNSFILYKQYINTNMKSVITFRTDLARELIGEYCSRKRPGRPSVCQPVTVLYCTLSYARSRQRSPLLLLLQLQKAEAPDSMVL